MQVLGAQVKHGLIGLMTLVLRWIADYLTLFCEECTMPRSRYVDDEINDHWLQVRPIIS